MEREGCATEHVSLLSRFCPGHPPQKFLRTFLRPLSFLQYSYSNSLEGTMKKVGIIIFAGALVLGLVFSNLFTFGKAKEGLFNFSFFNGVRGSGNTITEKRNLTGFRAVDVGGIFKVEITAQKDFAVEVEADDNL